MTSTTRRFGITILIAATLLFGLALGSTEAQPARKKAANPVVPNQPNAAVVKPQPVIPGVQAKANGIAAKKQAALAQGNPNAAGAVVQPQNQNGEQGNQGEMQNGQAGDQGEKQNNQQGDQGEKQNGQIGDQGEKQNNQQGEQGEKQNGQQGNNGSDQVGAGNAKLPIANAAQKNVAPNNQAVLRPAARNAAIAGQKKK